MSTMTKTITVNAYRASDAQTITRRAVKQMLGATSVTNVTAVLRPKADWVADSECHAFARPEWPGQRLATYDVTFTAERS